MLSAWPGAAEAFERAIAADPDFALAHIARARIHSFYQQGEAARKEAALARDLVACNGTVRERAHVETLALAAEGQLAAALSSARNTWKSGRAMTERAFDMRRNNAYAAHALLHAMFEDGSVDDADRLVTQWIGGYDRSGILHGHILWHQALGALEQGDAAEALAA